MQIHELKTWSKFYREIANGYRKRYELRQDDGRDFKVGDFLHLREYDPKTKEYSGKSCMVEVLHIIGSSDISVLLGPKTTIPMDLVIMSIGEPHGFRYPNQVR